MDGTWRSGPMRVKLSRLIPDMPWTVCDGDSVLEVFETELAAKMWAEVQWLGR